MVLVLNLLVPGLLLVPVPLVYPLSSVTDMLLRPRGGQLGVGLGLGGRATLLLVVNEGLLVGPGHRANHLL